jgi:GT2 family glycosyltransferase
VSDDVLVAVIVSYQTRDRTSACVASLLACAQQFDGRLQIVVVDNASTDGTVAALQERFVDDVQVLVNPRNVGYGAACNQGAAACPEATHVLFLNADTVVRPTALTVLVRALHDDPQAGIVAPVLEEDDGVLRRTVRGHPTPLALLHQHTALRFLKFGRSAYARYKLPKSVQDAAGRLRAPVLNGAVLLLRTTDFRAVGGFDPRYFLYFEEADLCRRIGTLGLDCVLLPEPLVEHAGGASSSGMRDRALVWYLASLFQYVDRFHGRRFGLLYRALFKPLFLIRMLTDALRDVLALTFKPAHRTEKEAEVRLAARFFTRGMWVFLGA